MTTNIQKIIDDTMKERDGKWSRKSLQMFFSFVFSVIFGTLIVVSHFITETEINKDAILVFFGFMSLAGYSGHLTLKDKINQRETFKNEQP